MKEKIIIISLVLLLIFSTVTMSFADIYSTMKPSPQHDNASTKLIENYPELLDDYQYYLFGTDRVYGFNNLSSIYVQEHATMPYFAINTSNVFVFNSPYTGFIPANSLGAQVTYNLMSEVYGDGSKFIPNFNWTHTGKNISYAGDIILNTPYVKTLGINDTFSWTNLTGSTQTVTVSANNGVKAIIRTVQNYWSIVPPDTKVFTLEHGEFLNFTVHTENGVSVVISNNEPEILPNISNPFDAINIISPSNNTLTSYNSVDVTYKIKYPKFMYQNAGITVKIDGMDKNIEINDSNVINRNSNSEMFDTTFKVNVRLKENSQNVIRIKFYNGNKFISEKTINVNHKVFVDDGTGKDIVTGELYRDEIFKPIDSNTSYIDEIQRNDYSDDLFGELQYFGDKLISYITMPFRFIAESMGSTIEWLSSSQSWISQVTGFISTFVSFVPAPIMASITALFGFVIVFTIIKVIRG